MGALSLIFAIHPVCRVGHLQVVRLEAVLSSLRVFVGPSKTQRADADVLFAKLGGATSPYLSLVHDAPPVSLPRRPHIRCFVPSEF